MEEFSKRRPLLDLRPDLPESLLRSVSTATEMDPAKRFTSAGQLANALAESLGTHAQVEVSAAPAQRSDNDAALAALVETLGALHPDEMSPREALEALYALKTHLARPK